MKSKPFFRMVSPQSRTACWLAASTTTSGLSFSSAFRSSTTATFLPELLLRRRDAAFPHQNAHDVDGRLLLAKHVEQHLADGAVADQRDFQPLFLRHLSPASRNSGATIAGGHGPCDRKGSRL